MKKTVLAFLAGAATCFGLVWAAEEYAYYSDVKKASQ